MGTIPLVDESPERGLILRVQLQALPTGEGGRTQPIGDHYRGALSLQEWEEGLPWVYDVCLVFEEGEQLAPGEEGSALLWVLSPHLLPESLQIGSEYELLEGERQVARGRILALMPGSSVRPAEYARLKRGLPPLPES